MQASRKFLTTCVELRLAHNKIVSLNYPKILQLMTNLKAIDLGNNWIHSLDDVKQLSMLSIRSLRLDGNPLCSKYSFAGEYIRDIKKHFTELTKLVCWYNFKSLNYLSKTLYYNNITGWH